MTYIKLTVKLEVDEDGYPPVGYESLWGIISSDGLAVIDNCPLYVYGISKGDLVKFEDVNGESFVVMVVKKGGHSTLRIYCNDLVKRDEVCAKLSALGAKPYINKITKLFSVDIPPQVDFLEVDKFLSGLAKNEEIDYEDASLQHVNIEKNRSEECEILATIPFDK